jgi:hypothetical protein
VPAGCRWRAAVTMRFRPRMRQRTRTREHRIGPFRGRSEPAEPALRLLGVQPIVHAAGRVARHARAGAVVVWPRLVYMLLADPAVHAFQAVRPAQRRDVAKFHAVVRVLSMMSAARIRRRTSLVVSLGPSRRWTVTDEISVVERRAARATKGTHWQRAIESRTPHVSVSPAVSSVAGAGDFAERRGIFRSA